MHNSAECLHWLCGGLIRDERVMCVGDGWWLLCVDSIAILFCYGSNPADRRPCGPAASVAAESDEEIDWRRSRQGWMKVDAVHALKRLAGQPRRVVVVDIAVGNIEKIEHVDDDLDVLREIVFAF